MKNCICSPQFREWLPACFAAFALLSVEAPADDLAAGLWAGRAILGEVNEVVSAVNEDNVREQIPPQNTTPTSDQAEIQLLLHVDVDGNVRLLKSVAIVDDDADPLSVDEKLITDPRLFVNHTLARRIAATAFEFGDPAARQVIGTVATDAAVAASASPTSAQDAYAAALTAAGDAVIAAAAGSHSPALQEFVSSSEFAGSPTTAAAAARDAVLEKYAEGLRGDDLADAVRSGVLIALNTLSQMADGTSLNELPMTGSLVGGDTIEGDIFLGAYHPTNPFRHRRLPAHRGGYDINRSVRLTVTEPAGGNDFDTTERGVDRLTGTYEEEIFGLHKPLGQSGEFGLRTKGAFVLDRISRDAILND
ncbi:MAG: hypothetical protein ACI9R3_004590 [Verrucomicrobiales bacterium]|jgi:hypothetical protein